MGTVRCLHGHSEVGVWAQCGSTSVDNVGVCMGIIWEYVWAQRGSMYGHNVGVCMGTMWECVWALWGVCMGTVGKGMHGHSEVYTWARCGL